MNKILIIILTGLFFSCSKEVKSVSKKDNVQVAQQDTIKKNKKVLKSSIKYVDDWAELLALEVELNKVINSDIKSEKDLELLISLIENLKKTYPERFKVISIEARVKVLETEVLMLEQDLKDGELKEVEQRLIQIQKGYTILVGQIEEQIIKEKDYEKYN